MAGKEWGGIMDYILSHPLISLIVTLGAYSFAIWLQKKAGGHSLLNPIVVAIAIVVAFISVSGISYDTYMEGAGIIHFLLGTATVALAIPLYKQIKIIKKQAVAVMTAVLTACFVSGFVAWFLAYQMGAETDIQLSIISKSVTTPIAIGIAEKIGTIPSMAVFFVFTTGILGSLFATLIFKIVRMDDDKAVGFSLGATCHGLGVAKAFQKSETAGVFSVLGMSLMGLISGIIMPFVVLMFL